MFPHFSVLQNSNQFQRLLIICCHTSLFFRFLEAHLLSQVSWPVFCPSYLVYQTQQLYHLKKAYPFLEHAIPHKCRAESPSAVTIHPELASDNYYLKVES